MFSSRREKAILASVLLLIALTVVGMVGFFIISGGQRSLFDSLWLTMQILTTVGDAGMERSKAEEIWSIFLMVIGVVAVVQLGTNIFRFVLDGELREALGRRHLEKQLSKMEDHFIVAGFGRMGSALCEIFEKKNVPFVCIDNSEERSDVARERDYVHIRGNAMDEHVLAEARIDTARGLAACLPDDSNNVYVSLTARALNNKLTIVAKSNHEDTRPQLLRAGADHVLSPSQLAANRAMTKFLLPAVDDLMEIVVHGADLEVSKVSLERLPGAMNKHLRELELPKRSGLMVVAVVHQDGSRSFNPSPELTLVAGDDLIVIGSHGGVSKLTEAYGPQE